MDSLKVSLASLNFCTELTSVVLLFPTCFPPFNFRSPFLQLIAPESSNDWQSSRRASAKAGTVDGARAFTQPSLAGWMEAWGRDLLDVCCISGISFYHLISLFWDNVQYIQAWTKKWSPGWENFSGRMEAEVVCSSRKKIHQLWGPLFSLPCNPSNLLYHLLHLMLFGLPPSSTPRQCGRHIPP